MQLVGQNYIHEAEILDLLEVAQKKIREFEFLHSHPGPRGLAQIEMMAKTQIDKEFPVFVITGTLSRNFPYDFSTQNCPQNNDIVQFRFQSSERCTI